MFWGEFLMRRTVSATEIVSLRSLRRVANSWTICRSSSGGKLDDDMVGLKEWSTFTLRELMKQAE